MPDDILTAFLCFHFRVRIQGEDGRRCLSSDRCGGCGAVSCRNRVLNVFFCLLRGSCFSRRYGFLLITGCVLFNSGNHVRIRMMFVCSACFRGLCGSNAVRFSGIFQLIRALFSLRGCFLRCSFHGFRCFRCLDLFFLQFHVFSYSCFSFCFSGHS